MWQLLCQLFKKHWNWWGFCVAILLKMEDKKQHFWHIIYYFKKGKNASEIQNKKCAVSGDGAGTAQAYQVVWEKFCVNFPTGQCSMVKSRPVKVINDQIGALNENNQC